MRAFALILLVACVDSSTVVCGDGTVCPSGTECRALTDPAANVCATPDELTACEGVEPLASCSYPGFEMGRCYDGVCLTAGCGNGRRDPGELCEDGNINAGDGCSANCLSDERCGNGEVDVVNEETCDDSNQRSNDGCSSTCGSEQLRWIQLRAGIGTRTEGMAAYDPIRERTVVFGGAGDQLQPIRGTWEWDGASWRAFQGVQPPPRFDGAMAFDGIGVLVQSGGNSIDTWRFDGVRWELIPNPGISQRYYHSMAYDSRRKRVVLFGGGGVTSGTWEWDGVARMWTDKSAMPGQPPPRSSALMGYDPVRGVVVLAGGRSNNSATIYADTWTYDGTTWTNVTPSSGPAPQITNGTMAYDPVSQRLIASGGCSTLCISPNNTATLAWNGSAWTDLGIAGPPPLWRAQGASTARGILVVGGYLAGEVANQDTYLFESNAWRKVEAPASSATVVMDDLARDQLMVVRNAGLGVFETWLYSARGWRKHSGTTPFAGTIADYDPVTSNVLMINDETGEHASWNGTTWTTLTPSAAPSASFAMAFDGTQLTAFGGNTPGVGQNDETWHWTGTTWVVATPAHSPSERSGASMGYDPIRNELVLFGGQAPGVQRDDTWTYDGVDWTERPTSARPPPTSGRLVWNPTRGRLTLGAWEWDGTQWSIAASVDEAPTIGDVANGRAPSGLALVRVAGGELWERRWQRTPISERCDGSDADEDELLGCADGDCWTVCSPLCPPGTSCAATPTCGDGTCNATFETCRTCPADCGTCTPACGDLRCDTGETSCPGDCP